MLRSANPKALEQGLFFLLLFTFFWAPLPFGSNRPWATAVLFILLAVLLVLWLSLYLSGYTSISRRAWERGRWPIAIMGIIPFWVFFQTIPLPKALLEVLSPRAAELHLGEAGWIPISLDISATQLYLLESLACFCAFVLVFVLVSDAKRARFLLWALVLSGVFQATYGSLMVLSGLEYSFFVEKYAGQGVATGTFVNRNHLAGYLVMCTAAGTGLLLSELSSTNASGWRDLMRRTLRLLLSSKIILRVMLALMVIALVLTRSRMGNTAFFVSLGVAGVVALFCGRRFSPKLVLLLLSIFLVDAIIVGQWFGIDEVVERLERAAPEGERRLNVSARSSNIVEDFPLTGSGGGSYSSVFTYYQSPSSSGHYSHAHNDYVEFASDLGIPVLMLMGILLILVLFRAIRMQQMDHSRLQRGVGFSLIMVLVWLLIHSWVDFNLQIPANSVTLSGFLALAFAKLLPERAARD